MDWGKENKRPQEIKIKLFTHKPLQPDQIVSLSKFLKHYDNPYDNEEQLQEYADVYSYSFKNKLMMLKLVLTKGKAQTFNTTTEVPLIKVPNPQLLPGHRSINGCPLLRVCVHGVCVFTAVCVHLGWVKCRAQIPSTCHHTWPYVTSLKSQIE